jgi:hypothetical protein
VLRCLRSQGHLPCSVVSGRMDQAAG